MRSQKKKKGRFMQNEMKEDVGKKVERGEKEILLIKRRGYEKLKI